MKELFGDKYDRYYWMAAATSKLEILDSEGL